MAFENLNQDHKKYYDEHCQKNWNSMICQGKYAIIQTGEVVNNALSMSGGVIGLCTLIGLMKVVKGIYNAKNHQ